MCVAFCYWNTRWRGDRIHLLEKDTLGIYIVFKTNKIVKCDTSLKFLKFWLLNTVYNCFVYFCKSTALSSCIYDMTTSTQLPPN